MGRAIILNSFSILIDLIIWGEGSAGGSPVEVPAASERVNLKPNPKANYNECYNNSPEPKSPIQDLIKKGFDYFKNSPGVQTVVK